MLAALPSYLYLFFAFSVCYSWYMLFLASGKNKSYMSYSIIWITLQSILGYAGFYLLSYEYPLVFALLIPPTLVAILLLFTTKSGKSFIQQLDLKKLMLLHLVRIPVEFCLLWLYLAGSIPELMTFEGRNFDILAGITAPIVYYLYFVKRALPKKAMLIWNIAMFLLLLNIVVNALLSAPLPFQQFAFEQPNVGILYFPFNLLPGFIVPAVIFSHLVTIKKLQET